MRNWSKSSPTRLRFKCSRNANLSVYMLALIFVLAISIRFRDAKRVVRSLQQASSSSFSYGRERVWLLVFDDRWRVLVPSPKISISTDEQSFESASVLAEKVMKGSSDRIYKVGKKVGSDHIFALALETSTDALNNFDGDRKFIKPVRLVRANPSEVNLSEDEHMWMNRAISLSLRLFYEARRVPRLNPMEEAALDIPLCCDRTVGSDGDLSFCGKSCTSPGVFNILSVFPS